MDFQTDQPGIISRFSSRSFDVFSQNYARTVERLQLATWYDVAPFSLSLWPGYFSENLRRRVWWIKRNRYPHLALELLLDGQIIYEYAGKRDTVNPGELFLTVPGDSVQLRNAGQKPARQLQLIIYGGLQQLLLESLKINHSRTVRLSNPGEVESVIRQIGELIATKRPEDAALNSTLGYQLVAILAAEMQREKLAALPQLLFRAVSVMNADRGRDLNVDRLIHELGTSRTTLTRLFRQHLQTSPQAYLIKQRMESAKQLVCGRELSFKEISESLGFKNALYFSTAFKRYTGYSPKEFRARSEMDR